MTDSPPLHNLLVRHDNRFWPWDPRSCPDERCPWNEWARKHLPASEPEHQPERTYVPVDPLPEIGCTCARCDVPMPDGSVARNIDMTPVMRDWAAQAAAGDLVASMALISAVRLQQDLRRLFGGIRG